MNIDKQIKYWSSLINESDVPKDSNAMDDVSYRNTSDEKMESLERAIQEDTTQTARFIQVFLAEIYSMLDPQKRSDVSKLIKSLYNGDNQELVNAVNNSWNFVARNG